MFGNKQNFCYLNCSFFYGYSKYKNAAKFPSLLIKLLFILQTWKASECKQSECTHKKLNWHGKARKRADKLNCLILQVVSFLNSEY